MQSKVSNSTAAQSDLAVNDLGPLAWVLDEIRKSLEGAAKALKRFVWDAEAARGSDLAALDASQLRIARQQLHQAVGALEMVGLPGPTPVLRAMEAAVQKFVQHPEQCSQDAVVKIEYASFAVTEYLQGVLADKPVSAVSLFPQYRDVQQLVRADRIHPADLWPFEWRWVEPRLDMTAQPLSYGNDARASLDQSVLQLMKGNAPQAARSLQELSLGLSAHQTDRRCRIFWVIAAAYFEAVAHDLLGADLYVRRAASRILMQYASLAKGDTSISERLAQDLLFFCAQAVSNQADQAPVLSAVRSAYGLARFNPVNYELVQFGRFDPALLAQARKRITSAKETWSALSAGDTSKFKLLADQFTLMADSLLKLHPPSEPLAQALTRAIDTTVRSAQAPRIELAMEVATSVLYLEAAFDDLDPSDPQLTVRTASLAERLEAVRAGGAPQPLESWMEELYRGVSDKQTMGSVVGELRVSLGELEKSMDVFFRNPQDKTTLQAVPGQLSQMRGVLSVLGLDHAARAVLRMKGTVEQMLDTEIDEQLVRAAGTFEQLGNNLGALSFLIDMLNYQPALAKKLFVYDEEKGELKPLMGRSQSAENAAAATVVGSGLLSQELASMVHEAGASQPDESLSNRLDMLATHAALADQPAFAQSVRDAAVAVSANNADAAVSALTTLASTVAPAPAEPANQSAPADFEEDDLRDIFLEEAREVIGFSLQSLEALASEPNDLAQLTVLRRAFHTLKGSSRMVGLGEFGEAAWAFEQMVNSWLADQKTATREFRGLSSEAMAGFEQWIADIAANQDESWTAAPFCSSAAAMQSEGRYSALNLSGTSSDSFKQLPAEQVNAAQADEIAEFMPETDIPGSMAEHVLDDVDAEPSMNLDGIFDAEPTAVPTIAPAEQLASSAGELDDIDFDSLFVLSSDDSVQPLAVDRAAEDMSLTLASAAESAEAIELTEADFDLHFRAEAVASESTAPDSIAFSPAVDPGSMADLSEPAEKLEFAQPECEDATAAVTVGDLDDAPASDRAVDGNEDEKVKVIGGLRIGIPLYNVYLNEADEWSRRLVTEVAEWTLERHQPVSASTVALAHSLAGSSATVGFDALSEMARALEHALEKSREHHSHGASDYGQIFVDASEDIRRLLHQFAAGFLKQPDPRVFERLNQLEFFDSVMPQANDADGFDFFAGAGSVDEDKVDLEPAELPESKPEEMQPEAQVPVAAAAALLSGTVQVMRPAPPALTPVVADFVGAAALAFDEEDDDGIDAVDVIDPELFPFFEEECAELMPQLGGALRQWSARPDNQGARLEVLRVLHTLKGSARLAGAMRLGEMAHRIESEIEYLGSEAAASREFEALLSRFDRMQANFEGLRHADAAELADPSRVVEPVPDAALESEWQPEPQASNAPVSLLEAVVPGDAAGAGRRAIPEPLTMVMRPLRQAATASVRVRTQLLDRMLNQAGEVMITRSRLEAEIGQLRLSLNDMSGNLNRLRHQLRDIEVQAESQMQSRLALAKEAQAGFDPLEFDRFTRVQELTRMMAESVDDVATVQRTLQRTVDATEDDLIAQGRQTRELQRDLLRTRMVEFEGISERLYRVVRQASKETGKQVRLDLLGGTIEMDRGMLDRMTPAFEHLLRNCVAHGIENPQDRTNAGKNPVGLITVHLRQEGNDVAVEFSDDGAGLDLQRIREKALSLGLITPDRLLEDQEAANLIFMPGFSTAVQVTELAGRGIGMDVVLSEVSALGGRIETSTVPGKGTQFKLVLPLTTAVTQVVMIRSGSLSVGVPANVVETVRRASASELQQAYNSGTFEIAGEEVPFFWSGALLQTSRCSSEAQTKSSSVVVFRSAAQRIALHVDEVLGNREVVVKNLGPQLSRLPGLAGMSVMASGAVVLIYNPVALASIYGQQARAFSADSTAPQVLEASGRHVENASVPAPVAPQIPLILVVDDSITVRRVTQRLLLREGYRVVLAADGLQALERLQEERPAVVLSDIEMPRMDGFDLARNIRADQRLKGLPIIMITSRIAQKHREHAKALGVDDYLGKPYSEDELMALVRHYCAQETAISV